MLWEHEVAGSNPASPTNIKVGMKINLQKPGTISFAFLKPGDVFIHENHLYIKTNPMAGFNAINLTTSNIATIIDSINVQQAKDSELTVKF